MKTSIHPEYTTTKFICTTCGTTRDIASTLSVDEVKVETCSVCHPFYSGQQRVIDTAGRVGKFYERYGKKK